MSFIEQYNQISNLVSDDLKRLEQELVSEIDFSPYINTLLKDFLTKNTKRIRPLLAFLYLRASEKEITQIQYSYQTIIEIIHNASLIHDDVIDESAVRRGEKTLNANFNNKTAILTGDYLLSIALKKLNQLNNPKIMILCANTLENMCKGEINQYFNRYRLTTIEEYIKKTEQKTANLFQTALEGAVILSGEDSKTNIQEFARCFGIAFQIRDDLINISDTANLKPIQNDIDNGIYNAPVIFSGNTDNLKEGIEKTKSLLNNYIAQAKNALVDLRDNKYKRAIWELLEILNEI